MDGDDEAFEVSQEALLSTDFDDEATFNPSEDEEDPDELDNLNEDADIPLEQLRAMYGYGPPGGSSYELNQPPAFEEAGENDVKDGPTLPLPEVETSSENALLEESGPLAAQTDEMEPTQYGEAWPSGFKEPEQPSLFRLTHGYSTLLPMDGDDGSSSSDDEDYKPAPPSPTLDWRKEIRLGDEYQAEIPAMCPESDTVSDSYEGCDTLMWAPGEVSDEEVGKYLNTALNCLAENAPVSHSVGGRSEWALQHLLKCKHDCKEALKGLPPWESPVTPWTEEECSNFEEGLRTYGKNFYLIHKYEVSHRTPRELIQFYYLWKKTERHDYFKTVSGPRHGRKRTTGPSLDGHDSDSESDSQLNSPADFGSDSQAASAASSMPTSPHRRVLTAVEEKVPVSSQLEEREANYFKPILKADGTTEHRSYSRSPSADPSSSSPRSPLVTNDELASPSAVENGAEPPTEERTKSHASPLNVHSQDAHEPHPTPPDSPLEPPRKKPYTG